MKTKVSQAEFDAARSQVLTEVSLATEESEGRLEDAVKNVKLLYINSYAIWAKSKLIIITI